MLLYCTTINIASFNVLMKFILWSSGEGRMETKINQPLYEYKGKVTSSHYMKVPSKRDDIDMVFPSGGLDTYF